MRTLGICQRLLHTTTSCQSSLSAEETQDQQKAPHSLHYIPTPGSGEEVQTKAVPVHRRASRILLLPDPDGDPGEDLVPEPQGKSKEAPGGRAWETQDGHWRQDSSDHRFYRSATSQLYVAAVARRHVSVRTVVFCLSPPPKTHSAYISVRTIYCSAGIQHVPLLLNLEILMYFGVKHSKNGWRGCVLDILKIKIFLYIIYIYHQHKKCNFQSTSDHISNPFFLREDRKALPRLPCWTACLQDWPVCGGVFLSGCCLSSSLVYISNNWTGARTCTEHPGTDRSFFVKPCSQSDTVPCVRKCPQCQDTHKDGLEF